MPKCNKPVVVSSRPDDVRAYVPAATIVASAAAAFAMPDVDLVVVAAPSDLHTDLALRAIAAGKHVVVDKPFALSVAAAREVADLASQRGVIAAAFQNRRWDGDFLSRISSRTSTGTDRSLPIDGASGPPADPACGSTSGRT